jgi:hypothetical protein
MPGRPNLGANVSAFEIFGERVREQRGTKAHRAIDQLSVQFQGIAKTDGLNCFSGDMSVHR